jgi:hypothetical protein
MLSDTLSGVNPDRRRSAAREHRKRLRLPPRLITASGKVWPWDMTPAQLAEVEARLRENRPRCSN